MRSLSFVIPVLNEAGRLPALLNELRANFPDAETLVVDGGSSDDSVPLAMDRASAVLVGESGRARQMNLGAGSASGGVLCFLHADSVLPFRQEELLAALGPAPGWAYCRIELQGRSAALPLISRFIHWRSRLTRVVTGDQMLIVNRALFEEIGGFADIPLMEDVEICSRLRRHSSPQPLNLRIFSSGRRWDEQGVIQTVLRMWALRLAYFFGVSPQRLWHHYYGRTALDASKSSATAGASHPDA